MKFATYRTKAGEAVGVVSPAGDTLYPIAQFGLAYQTMLELIAGLTPDEKADIKAKLEAGTLSGIPLAQVELMAPIPYPRDFLAVGQNYVSHVKETCRVKGVPYNKPQYPIYFHRRVNRAVAPEGKISLHESITSSMDYEVELAVVIGKECKNVAPEDVYDYIFGYTVANDITARDLQKNHVQLTFGKGLDDNSPLGPFIVTTDELPDPHNLRISLKVNGELRQAGNTDDFIFTIPYMISELSRGMTLFPGDVFLTGTPSGVGIGMDPPIYLKRGDVIEAEIQGIGVLRNVMELSTSI